VKKSKKTTVRRKPKAAVAAAEPNRYGIYISGTGKPEVADVILQILSAPHADEATKVAALSALEKAVGAPINISNTTIGNL
jgi:hypothetical protein